MKLRNRAHPTASAQRHLVSGDWGNVVATAYPESAFATAQGTQVGTCRDASRLVVDNSAALRVFLGEAARAKLLRLPPPAVAPHLAPELFEVADRTRLDELQYASVDTLRRGLCARSAQSWVASLADSCIAASGAGQTMLDAATDYLARHFPKGTAGASHPDFPAPVRDHLQRHAQGLLAGGTLADLQAATGLLEWFLQAGPVTAASFHHPETLRWLMLKGSEAALRRCLGCMTPGWRHLQPAFTAVFVEACAAGRLLAVQAMLAQVPAAAHGALIGYNDDQPLQAAATAPTPDVFNFLLAKCDTISRAALATGPVWPALGKQHDAARLAHAALPPPAPSPYLEALRNAAAIGAVGTLRLLLQRAAVGGALHALEAACKASMPGCAVVALRALADLRFDLATYLPSLMQTACAAPQAAVRRGFWRCCKPSSKVVPPMPPLLRALPSSKLLPVLGAWQ